MKADAFLGYRLLTCFSQFGGSVAEATIDIRNQFIRKVYTILTVQLVATGAVSALSFMSSSYKAWIQSHPGVVWISVWLRHLPFLGSNRC
jgi:FtsH-binding integral membrane protein